jgi:hypothetical protein
MLPGGRISPEIVRSVVTSAPLSDQSHQFAIVDGQTLLSA